MNIRIWNKYLWRVGLNGVKYVDEDQENSDKEGHPARDNLGKMVRRSKSQKVEGSKDQKVKRSKKVNKVNPHKNDPFGAPM